MGVPTAKSEPSPVLESKWRECLSRRADPWCSLLRINVPREGDVSAPCIRATGRDIRRREGPGFLGAAGLPRPERVLEPAIDELAGGPITGDAIAVVTQEISHFGKADPDQAQGTRETEGDVERTAQVDIAGNAQYGLISLLSRQWHKQLRTEGVPISRSFIPQRAPSHPTTSLSAASTIVVAAPAKRTNANSVNLCRVMFTVSPCRVRRCVGAPAPPSCDRSAS